MAGAKMTSKRPLCGTELTRHQVALLFRGPSKVPPWEILNRFLNF